MMDDVIHLDGDLFRDGYSRYLCAPIMGHLLRSCWTPSVCRESGCLMNRGRRRDVEALKAELAERAVMWGMS